MSVPGARRGRAVGARPADWKPRPAKCSAGPAGGAAQRAAAGPRPAPAARPSRYRAGAAARPRRRAVVWRRRSAAAAWARREPTPWPATGARASPATGAGKRPGIGGRDGRPAAGAPRAEPPPPRENTCAPKERAFEGEWARGPRPVPPVRGLFPAAGMASPRKAAGGRRSPPGVRRTPTGGAARRAAATGNAGPAATRRPVRSRAPDESDARFGVWTPNCRTGHPRLTNHPVRAPRGK